MKLPLYLPVLAATLLVRQAASAQEQILPIGQVQGSVLDTNRGTAHKSLYAGDKALAKQVTVQGVVTGRTLGADKVGNLTNGFFLQNSLTTADRDLNSSDGIWVFMGRPTSVRPAEGGPAYTPKTGDEIVVTARVVEYFGQTQLSSPRFNSLVRSGVDLDKETPAFEAAPPDDIEDANRYWERREGMRASVPGGALVILGRRILSGGDGEVELIRGDHAIAKRENPYARRAYRDFHPLDDKPGIVDNGNGYRINVGAQGLKAAAGNVSANLDPVRTYSTLNNTISGPVLYSFGRYVIQPEVNPKFTPGADPSLNGAPRAADRTAEYSVATFNVENLYDFRDDPNDGCDFKGNPGCGTITPPFDYAPSSQEEYDIKRQALAQQVVQDLHSPDIIMVEEAEDQDICKVENGQMACGTANNADGSPDTIQEMALDIEKLGGPKYLTTFDRDAADQRGIIPAFLYRADRVSLETVTANHPILGENPVIPGFTQQLAYNTQIGNPKALNAELVTNDKDTDGKNIFTRAPQVAAFRLKHADGTSTRLYCIANHFSSRPDKVVEQRRAQATFVAALAATLMKSEPNSRVLVGGDLNVFPRPDDPFTPRNRKNPSDQLASLYDAGLFNLFDVMVREDPASAYSYAYQGQAQTIDHIFVSRNLRADLKQVREAHINADWPGAEAIEQNGKKRGVSDHDPCVAIFANKPQPIPANLDAERPGPIQWPITNAEPLADDEDEKPRAAAATTAALPPGTKLNINTATEEELMALPGVGPVLAKDIVDYRAKFGLFKSVEALDNVKGIGPATLAKLRPLIVLK